MLRFMAPPPTMVWDWCFPNNMLVEAFFAPLFRVPSLAFFQMPNLSAWLFTTMWAMKNAGGEGRDGWVWKAVGTRRKFSMPFAKGIKRKHREK